MEPSILGKQGCEGERFGNPLAQFIISNPLSREAFRKCSIALQAASIVNGPARALEGTEFWRLKYSRMSLFTSHLSRPEEKDPSIAVQAWAQLGLLAISISLLFYPVLAGLIIQWWEDPNYSHGFFIPLFCGWVVWNRRDRLRDFPVAQDWFGLPITLGAMAVLALGVLGAENFLSRVSLLFLLAGLIIQFRGWAFFRQLIFPWAVLFLMIPLPAIVFNQLTLPLQFLASRLATFMLSLAGVPVLRQGNIIHLPSLSLDVAEACSGLRSLVSLVAIGVLYGYFHEPRSGRRLLLAVGAIPVAVVSNSLRIMGSGLLGEYWRPEKAEGFFHTLSGVLVFVISLILLVFLHAALGWMDRRARFRRGTT